MVLVHESDPRFGAFDFRAAREKAPSDLQDVLDNHESLPFRRRGYERDGMLQTLIEHAGFKALLQAAQASATATAKELAKVPTEIQHFDLESFHDRPVQTVLVELLLLILSAQLNHCRPVRDQRGHGPPQADGARTRKRSSLRRLRLPSCA